VGDVAGESRRNAVPLACLVTPTEGPGAIAEAVFSRANVTTTPTLADTLPDAIQKSLHQGQSGNRRSA
jgi:hypothetical protein